MLSDEQIMEEARKRVDAMDPEKKAETLALISDGYYLSFKAVNEEYSSLTREEKRRFHAFNSRLLENLSGGGYEGAETEYAVKKDLNLTREEIAQLKTNPYTPAIRKSAKLLLVCVAGIVAAAALSKAVGFRLGVLYLILSCFSCAVSVHLANLAIRSARFRALQRNYEKPAYQESEINAAVFRILKDQVKADKGLPWDY